MLLNIIISYLEKETKMTENGEISDLNQEAKPSHKDKLSNAKETFLSWSKSVDINCYNKMLDYSGNYFVQFIWFMILLGSTGATFYLIAKSIMDYLKYEVITEINIVNKVPTEFPTVTFCDNNPFTSKMSSDFIKNISITNQLDSTESLIKLAKYYAASKLIDDETRKLFKTWSNQICYFKETECSNDLHWYWSFDYGNCYRFNSSLNVSKEGKDFGLEISWFPIINENKYLSTRARGLAVFVHDRNSKPDEVVYVEPGKMAFIAVKRKVLQKYPWPYSDCIDLDSYKSDLFDYITKTLNKTYRQQDCFELCIQKTIIDSCQCYYTKYDDLNTQVEPCLNLDDLKCIKDTTIAFNSEECQSNSCPLECDSILYDLTLSSLDYLDEITYETNINNDAFRNFYFYNYNLTLSYDLYKSNIAFITIYYPSLQYEKISESPKTQIIDLFTQIGGALGMFVSFSIFTIFELIEIFLLILKDFLFGPKIEIVSKHM
jgi:hypothetical protein